MIRRCWPALLMAGLLLLLIVAWRIDRAAQYGSGYQQAQADARALNIQIELATQEEADRADAEYRGAIMAREAAKKTVATQRARIDGLLDQLRRRSKTADSGSGSDGAGADWIGVLGSCVAEYERLGNDTARLADKVNGLQGYVRSISLIKR
ncbi:hypothetical protein [Schauerella aestuarii]|uniref:hypothetical protein n=1 Tax=Schauerella aestuarii TaxID=2511204 RepID=UPI001367CEFE|nr:hypothetical protein [Achromobacter aestuarii]MYZ41436.1 hypothetical protein [Achromobacter aestuarii]